MTDRIFIWVGHPRAGSFCEALADRYQAAAEAAGASVRRMNLADMQFDIEAFEGYRRDMPPLEPDLAAWQDAVSEADHVLFVHPYWWGAMPAKAKAVLDRALLPGFGFRYHRKGILWDKLLTGRTADIIITSDTPPLLDTLLYGKPGRRVLKNQVLEFCGIKVRAVRQFGVIKTADERKRASWLQVAERMGAVAGRRTSRNPFLPWRRLGHLRNKHHDTARGMQA